MPPSYSAIAVEVHWLSAALLLHSRTMAFVPFPAVASHFPSLLNVGKDKSSPGSCNIAATDGLAVTSQRETFPSIPATASRLPSGLYTSCSTLVRIPGSSWGVTTILSSDVSQIPTNPSSLAAANAPPSGLTATHLSGPERPTRGRPPILARLLRKACSALGETFSRWASEV